MMKNTIITLFLLHFFIAGFAQGLVYEVRGIYKQPIQKEKVNTAQTMRDINPDYPSSWIPDTDYISSEILATCKGEGMKAMGKNDTLSTEQKHILRMADTGTDIVVEIKCNFEI